MITGTVTDVVPLESMTMKLNARTEQSVSPPMQRSELTSSPATRRLDDVGVTGAGHLRAAAMDAR